MAASQHEGHGCSVDEPLIRALYRVPSSACTIAAAVTAVIGVKILVTIVFLADSTHCQGHSVPCRSVQRIQNSNKKVRQTKKYAFHFSPSSGLF